MDRAPMRRLGRLLVVGLAIAAVARVLTRARTRSVSLGGAGATSVDTWPPVPVNADRALNQ